MIEGVIVGDALEVACGPAMRVEQGILCPTDLQLIAHAEPEVLAGCQWRVKVETSAIYPRSGKPLTLPIIVIKADVPRADAGACADAEAGHAKQQEGAGIYGRHFSAPASLHDLRRPAPRPDGFKAAGDAEPIFNNLSHHPFSFQEPVG
ncbi:MAG: hypothetical protein ACJ74W_07575 [Pyrinomonadaceae bacterium]